MTVSYLYMMPLESIHSPSSSPVPFPSLIVPLFLPKRSSFYFHVFTLKKKNLDSKSNERKHVILSF